MKRILGLDLGTNSIGWALVKEKENDNEQSSIKRLGVREIYLTTDEQSNFEKGKSITTNADRTLKRSMRRNLQRYKLRRDSLISVLKDEGFITADTLLNENGNRTTFETYRLRARAAAEEISLEELSRVLLMINKKRGYKSSRKAKADDESGQLIDGMEVAKKLYDDNLTPGQYVASLLRNRKNNIPDFYRSDLVAEFDKIWSFQRQFYPDVLTDSLKEELKGKGDKETWAICSKPFAIVGIKRNTKGWEQKKEDYAWRAESLQHKIDLERLAIVLQKVNGQIRNSSGYLGAISDRSKELFFNKLTVGQYQMAELDKNPNFSLKNQVFYRQDYLDEFERIWETQSKFHKELTPELKHLIRDIIIFYQRPLKSQKGLISLCELESREIEIERDGKKTKKTIGPRVCPKSSPMYQEFRIWQAINNLQVSGMVVADNQVDLFGKTIGKKFGKRFLEQEEKEILFKELNFKSKLTKKEILKLLFENYKELDLNYNEVKGNTTMAALLEACSKIIEMSGHGEYDFSKMSADEVESIVFPIFNGLGFNTDIFSFDSSVEGKAFDKQPSYMLWHLLYSYEGDKSKTGNESLISKISECYGFDKEYAAVIAGIRLEPDYGNLSVRAMHKILPYMKDGLGYSDACQYAGYRHSKRSLTKEEIEARPLKDKIDLLPRNSLRNPVVEKILNQMINVVNAVVDAYGRPDEIRVEMARELKKTKAQREETVKTIRKTTAENEKYKKELEEEFGLKNVSRNDIIKYRLYLELKDNGFKTLYSNTYIPREKLFSKEFDIEHIIPQAKLFDDSFSNKTIEARNVNIEKADSTAYDYVQDKYGDEGLKKFKEKINQLYGKNIISKTKLKRLLTTEKDIPDGFINRDLNNTQYIARKACEILEEITRRVVPTTGSVTSRLREDWQLVDMMKELNWDKYDKLGLTEIIEDKDGRRIRHIKDWTKRNDQRHHAMDALTIAFTKPAFIQYLNNLNARSDKGGSIYAIERKELYRDNKGKLRFYPPMPLDEFRAEAKRHLEKILVSIKAKNKVVTRNVNITKAKKAEKGKRKKIQLTPRGQLHNETIYGRIKQYATKEEKVNASFTEDKIITVACKRYREALLVRLRQHDGDAKKAFTGKSSLSKTPLFTDSLHTETVPEKVKTVMLAPLYTKREAVSPDLKIEKVIDIGIKRLLQKRLEQYGGDMQKAFSNLDENPIWLNEEKGISIKRVTISSVSNAEALHDKRDNRGQLILDKDGKKQPTDFVQTSGNHHVAIFRDADGNLQEHMVSFYEATARAIQHLPIINKEYNKDLGWQFLFTMKQNEYFVFPNEETGFNPKEIDLLNPKNYALISPNLFRVQTMSKVMYGNNTVRDYKFRHHLETTVTSDLKDVTYKQYKNLSFANYIVKVRINHLGQIVSIGEY